jgi:FixJ family two-component response regulator
MKPNLIEIQIQRSRGTVEGNSLNVRKYPVCVETKRTILLVSADTRLHEALRCMANTVGRIVVRLHRAAGVALVLHVVKPAVVLLDLDIPKQAAWGAAEAILQEQNCPPVILLTAPSDQFDVRTALRAGCLLNKSEEPSRLLEAVEERLAMSESSQAKWNATQRVLIRWLKPCSWPLSRTQAYRF